MPLHRFETVQARIFICIFVRIWTLVSLACESRASGVTLLSTRPKRSVALLPAAPSGGASWTHKHATIIVWVHASVSIYKSAYAHMCMYICAYLHSSVTGFWALSATLLSTRRKRRVALLPAAQSGGASWTHKHDSIIVWVHASMSIHKSACAYMYICMCAHVDTSFTCFCESSVGRDSPVHPA